MTNGIREAMSTIDSGTATDDEKMPPDAELGAVCLMGEAQVMAESEYYNPKRLEILTGRHYLDGVQYSGSGYLGVKRLKMRACGWGSGYTRGHRGDTLECYKRANPDPHLTGGPFHRAGVDGRRLI